MAGKCSTNGNVAEKRGTIRTRKDEVNVRDSIFTSQFVGEFGMLDY
jgi:hypothetical protein